MLPRLKSLLHRMLRRSATGAPTESPPAETADFVARYGLSHRSVDDPVSDAAKLEIERLKTMHFIKK
jgi:hypothetical protein